MNCVPPKTAAPAAPPRFQRLRKSTPDPKARLRDQFHEVARLKSLAGRIGAAYWQWSSTVFHCIGTILTFSWTR